MSANRSTGCAATPAYRSGSPPARSICTAGSTKCTPAWWPHITRPPTCSSRCEGGRAPHEAIHLLPGGLHRLPRGVPRGRPAVCRGGRRLRGPGRAGARHRRGRRAAHRPAPGQQPSGQRPRGRSDGAGLRSRQGVRHRRARRAGTGRRCPPTGHGCPEVGALVPGDFGRRRPGHAGRHRPGPDRRTALRPRGRQGTRQRTRQPRRPARPGHLHRGVGDGTGRARHRRRHGRRPGAVAALAARRAGPPRTAGRCGARHHRGMGTGHARRTRQGQRAAGRDPAARPRRPRQAHRDRCARHGPRLRADRVRRVPLQRRRGRPAARRTAHGLRQGADGPGRGQRRLRHPRCPADDRRHRPQCGQRPGGCEDQGLAGAARRLAAGVRRGVPGRAGCGAGGRAGGRAGPCGLQAHPVQGAAAAVARAPR